MTDFIPVNEPTLNGNEKRYLSECIDSGWISSEGPYVSRFENSFAECVGREHGIAVANGSGALEIAVKALGIGSGDEVILPTFTIISCAAAIIRAGATPVVVDADPVTWNMNVAKVEELISHRTKAIMVVHLYGLPVEMTPLQLLARKYGLKIIEDAAEAHGLTYCGAPCGSFGDISTFSFYPNKHVTTGEGGMLVCDDPILAERCRSLRNLCFQANKRFVHDELGWNYRMTNLQAAVGLAQLERIDDSVLKKRVMGRRYSELLKDIVGIELPLPSTAYAENIYWVYGVVLKDAIPLSVEDVMKRLGDLGIGTRPFFWPMHEQPVFKKMGLFEGVHCPVAERLARRGFYLPSGLAITDSQIQRVVSVLKMLIA